jgi:hypothetical protein
MLARLIIILRPTAVASRLLLCHQPAVLVVFPPEFRPQESILFDGCELAKLPCDQIRIVASIDRRVDRTLGEDFRAKTEIVRRARRPTARLFVADARAGNLLGVSRQPFVGRSAPTGVGEFFLFLAHFLIEFFERLVECTVNALGAGNLAIAKGAARPEDFIEALCALPLSVLAGARSGRTGIGIATAVFGHFAVAGTALTSLAVGPGTVTGLAVAFALAFAVAVALGAPIAGDRTVAVAVAVSGLTVAVAIRTVSALALLTLTLIFANRLVAVTALTALRRARNRRSARQASLPATRREGRFTALTLATALLALLTALLAALLTLLTLLTALLTLLTALLALLTALLALLTARQTATRRRREATLGAANGCRRCAGAEQHGGSDD